MHQKYSIIVAGGSGSRMNSQVPKQFLLLANKPILVHTLEKFLAVPNNAIILVLPKLSINYWELNKSNFDIDLRRITVVEGGSTRFQSVKNGLVAIHDFEGLVAVHDGVRPLVSTNCINESFEKAAIHKAVVVAVPSKDSVRIVNEKGDNHAIERIKVKLIQTPQTFDAHLLQQAYNQQELDWFSDDASVVEHFGHKIHLIDGDYHNLKITTPEDLIIAEQLILSDL